ncbi:hypothetical protein EWX43_09535, partial [Campylobacter coli]|nr:hypothetical protein [Campylobacter coli]
KIIMMVFIIQHTYLIFIMIMVYFLGGDEGAGLYFRYMEVLSCKNIDKKFKKDDWQVETLE